MSDYAKEILALGHSVIKRVRLSNAVGAPVAVIVVVAIPCIVVYSFTKFWPILLLAAAPVVYFLYAFDYLMKNNPQLLRTEEHEEKMLQISVGMGEKGKEVSPQELDNLPAKTPAEAGVPNELGNVEDDK